MDVKTQKKLNYLDETKQLIREAIEEMGQTVTDTDSFRSYAEKIRAAKPVLQDKTITENGTYTADEGFDGLGEVTVDVAGVGGGSLPPGLYWEVLNIPYINNYTQQWFEWNGVLYVATASGAGAFPFEGISKYVNGAWNTVVSGLSIGRFRPPYMCIVEYNGKLHFSGGESVLHYTFDGTSFVKKKDLPNNQAYHSVFIQNGQLKFYSYYDGKVYVWDEASDTWTAEATPGSTYKYLEFYNINGTVYAFSGREMHTYDGSALTNISSCNLSLGNTVQKGDCIYSKKTQSKKPEALVEYNTITRQVRQVGTLPYTGSYQHFFMYGDKVCYLLYNTTDYFSAVAMHEVKE